MNNKEPILITKPEELDTLSNCTSFKFKCIKCGKEVINKQFHKERIESYRKMLCRACNQLFSCGHIRYDGVLEVTDPNVINTLCAGQIVKAVCKECGEEYTYKIKRSKERMENYKSMICPKCRFKHNYPSEQAESAREKTNMQKFGVKHAMQCDEIKDKVRDIFMDKYGKPC